MIRSLEATCFFSTIAHPQADPHTSSGQEKDQLVSPELIFCDSHPIHKKKTKKLSLYRASIVSGACRSLLGFRGPLPSKCHGGIAFRSHSLPLHFHHSKIFHWDEAAIRSPCMLPIPFASTTTHPPLSSLKSLHSSRQLSSGKRLAFWGVGGRVGGGALLRQRCRV